MADSDLIQMLVDAWPGHMRRGEFARAWEISDALLRAHAGQSCSHLPPHFRWVWDGSPLEGRRVLVRCYRGLGDTIQFARYLPRLKQMAAEMIVSTQRNLIPLVATIPGVDRVIEEQYGTPFVGQDAEVEMMELPFVFRTTLTDIPADIPYLHVAPKRLDDAAAKMRCGLVWEAGDWDTRRSVPFTLIKQLQDLQDITWYIMQRGGGLDDWDRRMGVLLPAETTFDEARVIQSLDLVISIDSMPAHLSGALGVPTWILLHTEADWRWLEERDDTPWYPKSRLFRQDRAGEWTAVLARVRQALEKQVANGDGKASR